MKKNTYTLNTLLVAVLSAVLLTAVLVRTFAPRMILPLLDAPNMVLISLVALVLDYYMAPDEKILSYDEVVFNSFRNQNTF